MTSKEDVCPLVLELKLRLWSLPCTEKGEAGEDEK